MWNGFLEKFDMHYCCKFTWKKDKRDHWKCNFFFVLKEFQGSNKNKIYNPLCKEMPIDEVNW